MKIKHFFDKDTFTLTYVVYDEKTKDAVIIDPVLNYEPQASHYTTEAADEVRDFVTENILKVHYIMETHAHADHLTGAQILKSYYPEAKMAIGKHITKVQGTFKHVFNFKDFNESGVQFDVLLDEGEPVYAGSLKIEVLFTPGHTPACSSYVINDEAVFTGDALFIEDFGTGRCDFPGGSAEQMYDSVTQKLFTLPDDMAVYVGHDYQPGGRELRFSSTIGVEKKQNKQLNAGMTKEEFVKFRTERDATLTAPRLLLQSLQVNIDAGKLPDPEDNGKAYLKIPFKKK